jgi:lysyl-tRNA synthetase class 2
MDAWQPGASIQVLRQRAELIAGIRGFFHKRGVLEVETPSISHYPTVDLHLDSFTVHAAFQNHPNYLITSPEYHMKRLLASGSGSIYQLCKAFRCDEAGSKHNPEFTILEWYREGWNHWTLMQEVDDLLRTLLNTQPAEYITYQEVFAGSLKVDPLSLTRDQFAMLCREKRVTPPADLLLAETDRDERLNYLLGLFIEPGLGKERPVFLHDYPASQANLAKLNAAHPGYAMRFEVYYQGVELGNGFCELTDSAEQEKRFQEVNRARVGFGKQELPIDDTFLAALKAGMPDCAGVAMGVDRMIMLALDLAEVDRVMAFSWKRA